MQEQLSDSMYSSEAVKDLQQHQRKFASINNLTAHLKTPKKTILLVQNKSIEKQRLNMIASYTFGISFQKNSDKKYQYDTSNLDLIQFPFCSLHICVVEAIKEKKQKNQKNRDHRVIYLTHLPGKDSTGDKFINLGQFYFVLKLIEQEIRKYPNENQTNYLSVYGLIQQQQEKILKPFYQHFCIKKQLNLICLQAPNQNLQDPKKIQLTKDMNKHQLPNNFNFFAGSEQQKNKYFNEFDQLAHKKFTREDVSNLQKYRLSIQKLCVGLFTAITKVMALVVNKKQKEIQQNFACYVSDFQIFLQKSDLQFQIKKQQKLDKQLAYKIFVLRLLAFVKKYKETKINSNKIQWISSFFKELSKQLSFLPCITQQQQKYFLKISEVLTSQLKLLNEVSSQCLAPQIDVFLSELKIKDQKRNNQQDSLIRLKVFEATVNLPTKELADLKYYDDFIQLLKMSQQGVELKNMSNKEDLMKKKKQLQEKIPKFKLNAALNGESSTRDQSQRRIQSICDFFIGMWSDLKNKKNLDWKILVILFKKSAVILKNNGFPEIAEEIFKKIKFENEVESCLRDKILKFQYRQKVRSDKYKEAAEYFEHNGRLQKALEYAQKAYENYPESNEFLIYQIKLQKKLHTYQADKAYMAVISALSHEKLDDFYNYKMKDELFREFETAPSEYKKINSSFSLPKSSSEYFNFSFQLMNL